MYDISCLGHSYIYIHVYTRLHRMHEVRYKRLMVNLILPHSMATIGKCHDGPCGPCFLCASETSKYTHPERFSNDQYTFLCKFEDREINKTVCICYACYKQIQRNIHNTEFKPRWKKKSNIKTRTRCSIESCENTAIKTTHLASKEDIEHILDQPLMSFTVEDAEISVPLCQTHYNQLYTQLSISSPCKSCGGKPRKGERFNRRCPHPESINTYLTIVSMTLAILPRTA